MRTGGSGLTDRDQTLPGQIPTDGIGAHLGQFLWLAASTVLVGMTVGMERTVVPLIGADVYHLTSASLVLSFIVAFGLTKAVLNLVAGHWSDQVGRRRVLRLGWLTAVPMVGLLLFVHAWLAVIAANVLLGANQAFTWTMTITSQMDLVGSRQRGLAMGINEGTGYLGVAISAAATAFIAARWGMAQAPFVYGAAVVLSGLAISLLAIDETRPQPGPAAGNDLAVSQADVPIGSEQETVGTIFWQTSVVDATLSSLCQAGLANKLADTLVWGVVPLYLASLGRPVIQIGLVAGTYAAVWGLAQFGTGLLSDYFGRKPLIVGGMALLGGGILLFAAGHTLVWWVAVAALMGLGMALLYPNLNAAVGDVAPPSRRGAVLGVYRLWRDGGYAVDGLLLGVTLGPVGMVGSIVAIGLIVLLAAAVVAIRMQETHPPGETGSELGARPPSGRGGRSLHSS